MRRLEAIVSGRVQDVFYRVFVKQYADTNFLSGSAKNMSDGTVFIIAEGEEEKLRTFLEAIKKGNKLSRVEKVKVVWKDVTGEFTDFRIE